jgi:dUTP diphosphatase
MTQIEKDIKLINETLGENTTGTLSDNNIIDLYTKNKLLFDDNFEIKMVKQCCYELRASEEYVLLSNEEKAIPTKLKDGKENYILIKPNHQIVILTKESLNIPGNIIGRIMTKGSLFSIGLIPVNTYADPGFKGKLGIVFSNLSNNYIKITPDEPIAKIEFSKIIGCSNKIYSGQHGYETHVWPIRKDMILTTEEMRKDSRIFKSNLNELESVYGNMIAQQYKDICKYQKGAIISLIFYIIFNLILFIIIDNSYINTLRTIGIGLITNIIYAVVWRFYEKSYDIKNLFRRKKWN